MLAFLCYGDFAKNSFALTLVIDGNEEYICEKRDEKIVMIHAT